MDDPYRAPSSVPLPPVAAEPITPAMFYAPSLLKVVTLSLATFGLFELYWFVRNWRVIKYRTNGDQWPWARAIFSVLWCFFCFSDLQDLAGNHRRKLALSPGLLGTGYLLLHLSSRLPDPLWLISLPSFLPLLPVNALLRQYNQEHGLDMRQMDRIGPWHYLLIILGTCFMAMVLAGLMLTVEP